MCEPITLSIITAATAIGGAIVGADSQRSINFQNKKSARLALESTNRDISLRALQERIAAAQESQALNTQAAEATGITSVSAAGGNVGGMTVDMLLEDINTTRLEGQSRITDQRNANLSALDRERSGALASSRNRANQTSPPNPFATGLRIAGGALDGYNTYRQTVRPKIIAGGK